MPGTTIERGWSSFDGWVLDEIRKYKTRFIHLCYKVILPKELYALAKDGNDMKRVERWALDEGWKFREKGPSTLLMKHGKVIGEFRPTLEGVDGLTPDPHLVFYAQIAGEQVELVEPDAQRN